MGPFIALVLCALVAHAASMEVKHVPCNGVTQEAKVSSMSISPCTQQPCQMHKGKTYEIAVAFTTAASPPEVESITTSVYGIIAHVPVPFPGFNQTDACKGCNLECPLGANKPYVYKLNIYVPTETIDIDVPVKLKLVDNTSKEDLICQLVEVQVVG